MARARIVPLAILATLALATPALGLGVPAELQKVRDEMRDQMLAVLGGTDGDRAKTLRARADRVAREFGPIEVATFDA
jgi:hypothetical protein